MNLSNKVMRGEIPKLCLLIATLVGSASGEVCTRGSTWWDRQVGDCVPCTRCDTRRLAVKLPCEIHRDTICQPLSEVRIWPFSRRNDSELSDDYEDVDYDSEVTNSVSDGWDLETVSLVMATSGCMIFFFVVLVLSLYHARQWKVLKRALKSDVQDLTAKLRLMEAGQTQAEPVLPADHHIYCNIHVGKEMLLGPPAGKGLGNVYTQEKHQT